MTDDQQEAEIINQLADPSKTPNYDSFMKLFREYMQRHSRAAVVTNQRTTYRLTMSSFMQIDVPNPI